MPTVVHHTLVEGVAVVAIDHPPVNASSQAVRRGLMDALAELVRNPAVTAVLLTCKGRTFMAGADIREFTNETIPEPDPNTVHALLESFQVPVVAALFGTVLGGGLELALACHYRVALRSTSLGLPEVTLGLVPGSGGTQRLPRLIGVAPALRMIVTGKPISAPAALDMGLVDAVFDEDLDRHALAYAAALGRAGLEARVLAQRARRLDAQDQQAIQACLDGLPPADRGGYAARACAQLLRLVDQPFAQGLREEREAFMRCRDTTESQALRHAFFAEREAGRIPGPAKDATPRTIACVGVVGAGTMGVGIAMSFANAGIPVILHDLDAGSLSRASATITASYRRLVDKHRLAASEAERRGGLIRVALDDAALAQADLIVEAAFEQIDIKETIFRRLGEIAKPTAILASNTSSLDIDHLARCSGRPADVLGMHFFSPAHIMRLVEVVRGARTAPDALATAMILAKRMGKVPVVSGVCYGFIGNRMLEGYLRETESLLLEGATPARIDGALEAFGLAMGPCRMLDLAGVDVAAKVVLARQASGHLPPDPAYRVVVQTLHDLGRHGQKTGTGFYRYEDGRRTDAPELPAIMAQLAHAHGIRQRPDIGAEEIVDRCLLPLMMEGYRILEEGIAARSGDIDTVWLNGYGFPAWRGGPMFYARTLGRDELIRRMETYARTLGNAFAYWDVPRIPE
ncbi:3-hydroxyacyl-CoA dehydrogenase NAD-binding domain-containing protein [Castellaniella sp. GW247-6E4]|uniref:3-hydroxyacyl-CoA dehydrogenase NAD-binding domain-containing protein n=1 Tax=Castellaniella sp. GW247-6E4 TaxID=3140380 RepID=UPI0033145402